MKLALVFPGQGSQSIGMMQGFADHQGVRDVFERASTALGQDLWKLAAEGPAEALSATVNTQPLMLTAAYAMHQAWQQAQGPVPAMMAGHSLGEYTALVVAGVLSFEDAVPLVRYRAECMQEAVPVGTGAMAAILGLDDDTVRAVCTESAQNEVVEAVNFNAPSQVVIAGHKSAVERAAAAAKARGAKRALMLPVSAPFHSSLLKHAAEHLHERLVDIVTNPPQIDVVNNVDVTIVRGSAQIKDTLARQAYHPVRWVETIRYFAAQGITHVVECGPGKVLSGLTKRIDDRLQSFAVTDPASLQQTLEALQ